MRRRDFFGQGAHLTAGVEILHQKEQLALHPVDFHRLFGDDLVQILDRAFVFGGQAFQRDKAFLDFIGIHGVSPFASLYAEKRERATSPFCLLRNERKRNTLFVKR